MHENASEKIVCEIAAILSMGRWVGQVRLGRKKANHNQYTAEPGSNKNCCQSIVKVF